MKDIAECQTKPYPNIKLISDEADLTKACLILTPENLGPIHLTVNIPYNFPLEPPKIKCDTDVDHPNVFDEYICASVLNTTEDYTPAYTIKGIAIQILSFFASDKLEQEYGGSINLQAYGRCPMIAHEYECGKCAFGTGSSTDPVVQLTEAAIQENNAGSAPQVSPDHYTPVSELTESLCVAVTNSNIEPAVPKIKHCQNAASRIDISELPDELLAHVCDRLDDEDLVNFSKSWNRVGGTRGVVAKFNLIRNREMQCFVLKKSFKETKLGIGVSITGKGQKRTLESEFDLLSLQAFNDFGVKRSVQGLPFSHWVPLPLSGRHFKMVQDEVNKCLMALSSTAKLSVRAPAEVIYYFMNDVVVKLSEAAILPPQEVDVYQMHLRNLGSGHVRKAESALRHASEKAIESYYHLFHLLLCLATSDKSVVKSANTMLQNFQNGCTSKEHCPNLGHLLLAVLISDIELTQDLLRAMIREAVTRNVVWMLDRRGANMPDLSYIEPDVVSDYRLAKTFEATKTSYRLLMFFNVFRNTINRGTGEHRKSLAQMRDRLFESHGAPPHGAAAKLAAQVKSIHEVSDFPAFLATMGVQPLPSKEAFTTFLRQSVKSSMDKGYSVWGCDQQTAKAVRENGGKSAGFNVKSFFPGRR